MAALLFVCTGNLCRSPMAEGMLRVALAARGLERAWTVGSAGTHARTGMSPPPFAIACAADWGADISGVRSRPLAAVDLAACARIVALDRGHLELLRALLPPDYRGQLDLLPAAAGGGRIEVPDPYGGARRDYAHAARLIGAGVGVLVEELATEAATTK